MSFSSLCINRPVLTIVMSITIVLFGLIGFTYLGVREYPALDPPIITVVTNYSGANPDVIETQITEPLEESINGIDGIRSITSTSSQGVSNITVEFNLESNLEAAANDVRDRVSKATRSLPADINAPPVVTKADANSDAIITITLQSDSRNKLELSFYADKYVKEKLQTIQGVSQINIWGEKKYAMRIWLDPHKLAALGLTPLDVANAIGRENIELPAGKIQGNTTELTIKARNKLKTEEEFNDLIVKERVGSTVRIKDIGYAALGAENEETIMKQAGKPQVGLAIVPQPGSNYIDIADEFYKRLEKIKNDLPADFNLNVALDNTKYIKRSVKEVEETILIAFILVIIIIYLFFRDWRSTLIPVVAIPISLISGFFIMYIAGFTINILTLLAIVLATGLVVDDAIVVLENIYSKVEKGIPTIEASHKGSKEIFFAIISTTITLAAVFLPIMFLQGFTGRLFREFGVVIAGTVIVSAFVSLSLTPMMSSRMLLKRTKHSRFYELTDPFFLALNAKYKKALESFMRRRWLAFAITGFTFILIIWLGSSLQSELAPLEDRSLIRMSVTAPEGSSFEYTSDFMDNLVRYVYDSIPETRLCFSVTAPGFSGSGAANIGSGRLALVEPSERKRSQQEIIDAFAPKLKYFTGARVFLLQEQTIGLGGSGRTSLPVQFVVQNTNFDKLSQMVPLFLNEISKSEVFQMADVNLKFNKPELNIEINREKANILGVSAADISQTIQYAFSTQRLGYFNMYGKQYQIISQVLRERRDIPLDLKSLYVKNKSGELIQLDNLVNITEQSSPPQLYHFNRSKSATFTAGPAKGETIGDGIDEMERIASKLLDNSFTTALSGTSRDYAESKSNIFFTLLLALVLIYLVLSAQFESFRDPLIIMFTVPLAIAGAVITLWYFGKTLNIFSEIGIIMLIGLVTKNGILIVEFANQRKEQGLNITEAVIGSAIARFRPILMTSLATVLGALPIALAIGAGSNSRVSMGIVVIGGVLFSLVLTLFVIPAVYTYFSKNLKKND